MQSLDDIYGTQIIDFTVSDSDYQLVNGQWFNLQCNAGYAQSVLDHAESALSIFFLGATLYMLVSALTWNSFSSLGKVISTFCSGSLNEFSISESTGEFLMMKALKKRDGRALSFGRKETVGFQIYGLMLKELSKP